MSKKYTVMGFFETKMAEHRVFLDQHQRSGREKESRVEQQVLVILEQVSRLTNDDAVLSEQQYMALGALVTDAAKDASARQTFNSPTPSMLVLQLATYINSCK